jgi:hypothetical protein
MGRWNAPPLSFLCDGGQSGKKWIKEITAMTGALFLKNIQ